MASVSCFFNRRKRPLLLAALTVVDTIALLARPAAAVQVQSRASWPFPWPFQPGPILVEETGAHAQGWRVKQLESACACLSWADLYSSKRASCGDGLGFEQRSLAAASSPSTGAKGSEDLCAGFFGRLNESSCVNDRVDGGSGQWCYVSADCVFNGNHAPGGLHRVAGRSVARKECLEDHDPVLSDRNPEELFQMGRSAGIDLGLLVRMAYQLEASKEDAYHRVEGSKSLRSSGAVQAQTRQLSSAQKLDRPRAYEAQDGRGEKTLMVIAGDKEWRVTAHEAVCERGCQ